jgi:hypothetical protein
MFPSLGERDDSQLSLSTSGTMACFSSFDSLPFRSEKLTIRRRYYCAVYDISLLLISIEDAHKVGGGGGGPHAPHKSVFEKSFFR